MSSRLGLLMLSRTVQWNFARRLSRRTSLIRALSKQFSLWNLVLLIQKGNRSLNRKKESTTCQDRVKKKKNILQKYMEHSCILFYLFFRFQKVASLAKEKYFVTYSLKPVDCKLIVISDALSNPTAGQCRFTTLSQKIRNIQS